MKHATLIYNPIAGRRPDIRERQIRKAAAELERHGLATDLAPTTGPGSALELGHAASAQGADLIVVCGGDGTINEVLNGILPGRTTLAILPGGTANVVAKELHLPHHPVRAARELGRWAQRRIAVGRAEWREEPGKQVSQRYFLSLAGIGFDAHIIHELSAKSKAAWGVLAYIGEAIRQSMRYSFPRFICRFGDRELRATFAAVQRSPRYAGWLRLAPEADIFQSSFSICAFKSASPARYLLYAAAVATRQHTHLRDVEIVQTQRIVCAAVKAEKPIYFELDGELAGELPATFEIIPDALNLLTPPQSA